MDKQNEKKRRKYSTQKESSSLAFLCVLLLESSQSLEQRERECLFIIIVNAIEFSFTRVIHMARFAEFKFPPYSLSPLLLVSLMMRNRGLLLSCVPCTLGTGYDVDMLRIFMYIHFILYSLPLQLF